LIILMLAASLVVVPEERSIAIAIEVPEYEDASNGLPTTSLWVARPEFFDLNNDGSGDVTILGPRKGPGSHSLHTFSWDGESWSDISSVEGTDNVPHWSYGGHEFGDLDNDGDWDVGAGSHGAERVDAYLRSFGTLWLQSSNGLGASEDGWNVDVGDFNNDGNLDLLVGGFWGHDLHAYAGDGNGNWVDQSEGFESAAASHAEGYFCDVNNDGNLDAIANLSDGNGGWTNSSEGLPGGFGAAPAFGDFNNDGNIDLAFSTNGETYAFEGDGTGQWTERSEGLPDDRYVSMRMADLNNDRFDDLVCMYASDPGIVDLYLADGNGSWEKIEGLALEGNAKGRRVNAGDFDHNGFNDVVAGFGTEEEFGSIRVWKEITIPTELGAILDYPNGLEYLTPGSVRFIRWRSIVPASAGTRSVKLELSTEGSEGPWTVIGEDLPDSGIHQWTVPDVQSGDCLIRITIEDSESTIVTDESDRVFGIAEEANRNQDPVIEILEPSQEKEHADDEYTISWSASDEDEDSLMIDLSYDNDMDPDNGMTVFAEGLENSGTYSWDCSEIEEGEYFIFGLVEDGNGGSAQDYSGGTVQIDHTSGNSDPTIEILKPSETGEEADSLYTVEWTSDDDDGDSVTIDLFYDTDTDPENGQTLIAQDLENTGSFDWDCSGAPEGEFFIHGIADDRRGGTGSDHSQGTIEIVHDEENTDPTIEILQPDGIDDQADEMFRITWSASDEDDDTLAVDLYQDTDTNPDNGREIIAASLENSGAFEWDTSDIAEGEYFILGIVDDGNGGSEHAYSSGVITIDHGSGGSNDEPEITITGVESLDDLTMVITWETEDQNNEDELRIRLSYDDDMDAENGETIIVNEIDDTGSFEWDLTGMSDGIYYVHAVVEDGNGGEGEDYSPEFTVELPDPKPNLGIDSLTITPEVPVEGDTVLVIVSVLNSGEKEGQGSVQISLDGVLVDDRPITLRPGKRESVSTTITVARGNHTIAVSVLCDGDDTVSNNDATQILIVDPPKTEENDSDDDLPIAAMGVVGGIGIILFIAFLLFLRKGSGNDEDDDEIMCQTCGNATEYSSGEDDYYCWTCEEYLGDR